MKTENIIKEFGEPGDISNMEYITLPFPMRIAWDLNKEVNKMLVHKKCSVKLLLALNEILKVYGYKKIKELGIDIFGGCFNLRKMRGGNDWSTHSWAIAIDLHPSKNPLKSTNKTALFAKPEFKEMIDILEKYGFYSLGKYKNYDWMHFQFIKP